MPFRSLGVICNLLSNVGAVLNDMTKVPFWNTAEGKEFLQSLSKVDIPSMEPAFDAIRIALLNS